MEEIVQSDPFRRLDTNEYEWVTTGGLGPCTGIFVYDHASKVAYAVHLPSPHLCEVESLLETLTAAAAEFAGSSGLVEVFVTGCCDDGDAAEDHAPSTIRTFVEAQVREILPNARHHFRWPEKGTVMFSMDLELDTGSVFYDEF